MGTFNAINIVIIVMKQIFCFLWIWCHDWIQGIHICFSEDNMQPGKN